MALTEVFLEVVAAGAEVFLVALAVVLPGRPGAGVGPRETSERKENVISHVQFHLKLMRISITASVLVAVIPHDFFIQNLTFEYQLKSGC